MVPWSGFWLAVPVRQRRKKKVPPRGDETAHRRAQQTVRRGRATPEGSEVRGLGNILAVKAAPLPGPKPHLHRRRAKLSEPVLGMSEVRGLGNILAVRAAPLPGHKPHSHRRRAPEKSQAIQPASRATLPMVDTLWKSGLFEGHSLWLIYFRCKLATFFFCILSFFMSMIAWVSVINILTLLEILINLPILSPFE